MPRNRNRVWMRKETRMLGVIQVMTGVILHCLGVIWSHLLVSQSVTFGKSYLPLAALSGYPFWSSLFFILSGSLTMLVEMRRSIFLVDYTIAVNIISACIAVIGLLLLLLELILFSLLSKFPIWPLRSGKMLSEYLLLFTFLELSVACTVIHWAYKAKYSR